MEPSYDIYLVYGCSEPPDWETVARSLGEPADAALQARMCERRTAFLGLDFPDQHGAAAVLRELRQHGANGSVIDARYRHPQVTVDEARPIAEREIERLIALRETTKPPVAFEPVALDSEGPMYWVFGASSLELMAQGWVPGALFASIDKLDGHVWTSEEFEQFGAQREILLGILPGS